MYRFIWNLYRFTENKFQFMESKLLTIGQVASIAGVSIQTLRRWDKSGKLVSIRQKKGDHRYYKRFVVEEFIRDNTSDLFKSAKRWAVSKYESEIPSLFYCQDISVFQARLSKLENDLGKVERLKKMFPLITAIAGEIGNNSFDHNLGNWPDMSGIFFAYDLIKKRIVLADRGQGILKTLRKARPKLLNHQEALKVAFTEVVSGRAPEYRGNGLKFVKKVIMSNQISLIFYTGDAILKIKEYSANLDINKSNVYLQGCLVLIKF